MADRRKKEENTGGRRMNGGDRRKDLLLRKQLDICAKFSDAYRVICEKYPTSNFNPEFRRLMDWAREQYVTLQEKK